MYFYVFCALRMDYCGIIVLTVTSYIPWLRFAFYNDLSVQLMYMIAITVFGAMGIAVVIRDEFREPHFRYIRFGMFLSCVLITFCYINIKETIEQQAIW